MCLIPNKRLLIMKIGYPCINLTIDCQANKTFRIRNYSQERLLESIKNNLDCLIKILQFNKENGILFFRISSDLIPFASHPICKFDWQEYFKSEFKSIGRFIKNHNMRISMHPDQFTLINSVENKIFQRSLRELNYHTQVLDLMGLDISAKIQIHIGGVYNDKEKSIRRFISRFEHLGEVIKRRLVIENDDKRYSIKDCLEISKEINLPVLFDFFHHEINNSGESVKRAFELINDTWEREKDGWPMVDYSSQEIRGSKGRHAETLNLKYFREFLLKSKPFDFDLMLEIKDKEKSALKAIRVAKKVRPDCIIP